MTNQINKKTMTTLVIEGGDCYDADSDFIFFDYELDMPKPTDLTAHFINLFQKEWEDYIRYFNSKENTFISNETNLLTASMLSMKIFGNGIDLGFRQGNLERGWAYYVDGKEYECILQVEIPKNIKVYLLADWVDLHKKIIK